MHADNRMHPKLTEFADILWGTRVLYQVKLLVSKELKRETVPPNAECWIVDMCVLHLWFVSCVTCYRDRVG